VRDRPGVTSAAGENPNHRLVGMITEADLAHKLNTRRLAGFVEKVYTAG
jgi:hypothetical protein